MKSIGIYTLFVIALAGGLLPAGRSLTLLIGGCEMPCCQKSEDGCCADHAFPAVLSCASCPCGPTQFAIQTVSPVQLKQDIHSQHNALIVPASVYATCDGIAMGRGVKLNSQQRPPDIPLFLEIRALLV